MKIYLKLGNSTKEIMIIVNGDVNGDGKVDFKDLIAVNKHRLNKEKLQNEFFEAGDIQKDNNVDFKDLIKINKFRLSKILNLF
jgi:Ca2+-binding EF-hand superfamily protein